MVGGPFADKYGRKITIIWADVFFTLGALLMGVAPSIAILILGRFVVGVLFVFPLIMIDWSGYCSNGSASLLV